MRVSGIVCDTCSKLSRNTYRDFLPWGWYALLEIEGKRMHFCSWACFSLYEDGKIIEVNQDYQKVLGYTL
jgi:predicted ester cyclase